MQEVKIMNKNHRKGYLGSTDKLLSPRLAEYKKTLWLKNLADQKVEHIKNRLRRSLGIS